MIQCPLPMAAGPAGGVDHPAAGRMGSAVGRRGSGGNAPRCAPQAIFFCLRRYTAASRAVCTLFSSPLFLSLSFLFFPSLSFSFIIQYQIAPAPSTTTSTLTTTATGSPTLPASHVDIFPHRRHSATSLAFDDSFIALCTCR